MHSDHHRHFFTTDGNMYSALLKGDLFTTFGIVGYYVAQCEDKVLSKKKRKTVGQTGTGVH